MSGHVEVAGKVLEADIIAVSEDHPGTIPEGVVEADAVIHVRDEVEPGIVDRVPAQLLLVKLPDQAQVIVCVVGVLTGDGGIALAADELHIEVPLVLVVVDEPASCSRRRDGESCTDGCRPGDVGAPDRAIGGEVLA
jgi:hypothetical protein